MYNQERKRKEGGRETEKKRQSEWQRQRSTLPQDICSRMHNQQREGRGEGGREKRIDRQTDKKRQAEWQRQKSTLPQDICSMMCVSYYHGWRRLMCPGPTCACDGVVARWGTLALVEPLPVIVSDSHALCATPALTPAHLRGGRGYTLTHLAPVLLHVDTLQVPQAFSQVFLVGAFRKGWAGAGVVFIDEGEVGWLLLLGQRVLPGVSVADAMLGGQRRVHLIPHAPLLGICVGVCRCLWRRTAAVARRGCVGWWWSAQHWGNLYMQVHKETESLLTCWFDKSLQRLDTLQKYNNVNFREESGIISKYVNE